MILGIGVDAANISRFSDATEGLIKRILTPSEFEEYRALSSCRECVKSAFLASRFAAKEAYSKARGTGFCDEVIINEIGVKHDELGKPFIVLEGLTALKAPKVKISLSLTHEDPVAVAFVILESLEGESDGKI